MKSGESGMQQILMTVVIEVSFMSQTFDSKLEKKDFKEVTVMWLMTDTYHHIAWLCLSAVVK